ncbi:hypothetical protein DRO55_05480 [Candidatus Bathyarchaeota archaeon]|nr:MAG: hypothetical protein DRO55_05480 [Candidatus Bathyarchaeota archaeon]
MLPEWLLNIPASTLFTLVISFIISLATTLLNRKLINKEQFMKWQEEINRWEAMMKRAKRTGDRKLLAKAKRQEPRIMQLRSRMMTQQMKGGAITFVPLLLVWQFLIGSFRDVPVAYLPGLNGPLVMPFFIWYIICSFFVSTIVSRILGVSPSMGLGEK